MKHSFKLNTLAVAVSLLASAQSAHALTPWTNGAPEVKIFTSGGAAQDRAIEEAIKFGLAQDGTLDVFQDVDGTRKGRRFLGYYFTGKNTLTNGLAGKRIYIAKRSLGAAGYGVVPVAGNVGLDNLDISLSSSNGTLGASQAGAWALDNVNNAHLWNAAITNNGSNSGQAAWSNYLVQNQLSDGGFTGVDAPALLQPGTDNYPELAIESSTGVATANWNTGLTAAALANNNISRVPTGGLVYGIGVPLDFYKVLQVAQAKSGLLPTDTLSNLGKYDDENYIPTLSSDFLASLLAGKIKDWGDVKFEDKLNSTGIHALTEASVLADAGVNAPFRTKVFIGRRNLGAAIGAVGYAKLLGYPYVEGATAPKSATTNLGPIDTGSTAPIVKSPAGANATDSLLIDWQNGTNTSGFNPSSTAAAPKKYWGFAVHGGDRNANTSQPWRYVRIDGAAPTIANVANGSYSYWAEGEVLIRPASAIGADKVAALQAFASALGNVAVAKTVNTNAVLPFGQSGVFATTATDPSAFVSIPFDPQNPIVPLSHQAGGGFTSLGVVPTAFNNGVANPDFGGTTNTVIELK
ncbi:MAG: hypothetical protein Q8N35_16810 [Methylococcaceae bacterium]|nr:hypothetical protein [Methylococcaceae bacterium]MDZ4157845.1 hypothetical protein [Methylococcales bacterium]MDP2392350.1 hypothetical protein [Methylococcaceae bacterium]MDP3021244.1 hypothetical protein [Methylococcaceae bacterium]MDP3389795.1 hypothetical protein [Methylococcaceae bacterium]